MIRFNILYFFLFGKANLDIIYSCCISEKSAYCPLLFSRKKQCKNIVGFRNNKKRKHTLSRKRIVETMKRFCQTLTLVPDEELIRKYVEAHSHVWPEVMAGQREVGILDMQIYRYENQVFMICDTVDEFDWERDMARLAKLPRQAEWEAFVAQCQGCDPTASSADKWHLMEKIFQLS